MSVVLSGIAVCLEDGVDHTVCVSLGKLMVHRKAYYLSRHACGYGKIVGRSGWEASVCAETADEGVEVSSGMDTRFFHSGVQTVTADAEFSGIDKNREM